ncbi:BolA/IbaG family iron-sulfur metabolism protein [Pelagibacteraceae bacterium]|nr:BolA/IbaG family iron-sulfur metabolism protein [Pelagibacteraceae bacterium]
MEKNLAHSIQQILIKSLGIQDIEVINNSHLHHHHQSSPQTGNSHFKVIIKSKELKSLNKIIAHQKVYLSLKKEMNDYIHSLEIEINE